ncbi:KTSC domain-containing protein [Bacillus sp. DX4.1]|uniref:KTSC domain-containing protein n=1 Tax=Bacillus sp. DX4.1 TaxID=3055867 RepID=UPI0025A24D27|nr:KTSC domain-containing protein [Bacillus sp. DX4.1]MDM5188559.1 KTSC domain-containing protein [Bacillus sp. DX4.1]
MYPVISKHLVAVGYNSPSMILRIQFKNGTYDYYNVPESIYSSLMSAPSKGTYHATHIKNSYRYTKIG